MPANGILHDAEHDPAAVRIEGMTGCQEDGARIINRSPGRQVLVGVMATETNEVANLFSLNVNHFQALTFSYRQRCSALGRNDLQCLHESLLRGTPNRGYTPGRCIVVLPIDCRNRKASD